MLINEMTRLEEIFNRKQKLCLERDLCAEFYNLCMAKANIYMDSNFDKANYYLEVLNYIEPLANESKQAIREINKEICEIVGVKNIEDTDYNIECIDRYGLKKSNLDVVDTDFS